LGDLRGNTVGPKRSAPLDKHMTIRMTEKEFDKILEYCADNAMSPSEYIRNLIRIHLGMADDFKIIYDVEPRPKK
jgi:hypothetical protein